MNSYKTKMAGFLFTFFSIVVLLISAITSFSFFYTFFPNMLPDGVLDTQTSQLISGIIGVTLFDLATAIWLLVFLQASKTSEQRGISLLMVIIAFLGAAMSSVAYLVLTATGELALDPETQSTIGIFSLVVVIIGVVANFGAAQLHTRYSIENKENVAESDWNEKLEKAHEANRKELLKLVESKMKDSLDKVAPDLANMKVKELVKEFLHKEGADSLAQTVGEPEAESPEDFQKGN